ncbi:uncharacterized protein LOC135712247 [Ochlerotatus camptorhynchus]|uniref:uncharacterized protein LOC135712247 n=1 Tax=Ochlerotatus camptorhynchus TaxID=644619 RepID=UPI0031E05FEA
MKFQWLIVLFVLGSSLSSVLSYPQVTPVVVTTSENATSPSPTVGQSMIEQDLKRVAMIGILFGAVQGEAAMEKKLNRQLQDLSRTFGVTKFDVKTRKVAALERSMERDKVAIGILNGALDLASQPMTYEQYRREMRKLSEREKQSASATLPLLRKNPGTINVNQSDYDLKLIKREVNRHINQMRRSLSTKIKETVQFLESHDALHTMDQVNTEAVKAKITMGGTNRMPDYSFYETLVQRDLENHIDVLFRRRQDDDDDDEKEAGGNDEKGKDSNENGISVTLGGDGDESESESEEEAPGGLVGLIANLSGGDEGSDVGALVGALSAAVTNLFGPGGLDVPGLLGTGAGLLAGLLGGDENFGKVLGSYVGIAIEGFSGGGADNNGAFFGNFLGSVIASLSSDPDDEDLPLRPKLFIDKFFSGLQEAKRKGDPDAEGAGEHKGSDLFGFIGNIVASVVGGITSLVLNASLGSSGGSSQGSADASGASSAGSSGDSCNHPCTSL